MNRILNKLWTSFHKNIAIKPGYLVNFIDYILTENFYDNRSVWYHPSSDLSSLSRIPVPCTPVVRDFMDMSHFLRRHYFDKS